MSPLERIESGSLYARLCDVFGEDPRRWPDWHCLSCVGQRNAGWVLECGRCGTPRPMAPRAPKYVGVRPWDEKHEARP